VIILDNEKIHKYLAYLDGRAPGTELKALAKLEELGVNIPNLLMKRYKVSRRWSDRALCVSHCMAYSKYDEDAYQLGIIALQDRSRTVRRKACMLLSVAQRQEAIKHLEKLLSDEALKGDAVAAIDALSKQCRH
jgi:hypothetical protein